ncbi:MAG: hypothetical protein GEU26_11915 [Nitrososphaeraceae archaeon]|nr:hypothetical protein [Nitrososphaeraceae archaeon]
MQSLRGIFEVINSDKQRLFITIAFIVISVTAVPAIVPHISHTDMVYHILVHTLGLIIAIFLTAVSTFAYLRNGGMRLFLMTIGFLLLVIMELLYLSYSTMGAQGIMIPEVDIELSHVILFAALILFASSIIKTK